MTLTEVERHEIDCANLPDGQFKWGIMHRPYNIGAGYRRAVVRIADTPLNAILSFLPEARPRDDEKGTVEHPVIFNSGDWIAVPFSDWVEETRRMTGTADAMALEEYGGPYG